MRFGDKTKKNEKINERCTQRQYEAYSKKDIHVATAATFHERGKRYSHHTNDVYITAAVSYKTWTVCLQNGAIKANSAKW